MVESQQGKDRIALQVELQGLQAQLEKKNRMLFGESSQPREREGGDEQKPKERAPKKGHGHREQPQLRILEVSHALEDADRVCVLCKGTLEEMKGQDEVTEEVDVIAREFVIRRHLRKKYRCRCGECIETAAMPPRLIRGGRYSLAFAIRVAVSGDAVAEVPPVTANESFRIPEVRARRPEGLRLVDSSGRSAGIDRLVVDEVECVGRRRCGPPPAREERPQRRRRRLRRVVDLVAQLLVGPARLAPRVEGAERSGVPSPFDVEPLTE